MRPTTVYDLVQQVRSQLNEENRFAINTNDDILPALNRAQAYVEEVYSRHYPDALLGSYEIPFVGGQQDYTLPEGIFGDRIVRVELIFPHAGPVPLPRVTAYEQSRYAAPVWVTTPTPSAYMIHGKTIRFLPTPSGSYSFRLWAVKAREPMVLDWGRVTKINWDNRYVIVDNLGGKDAESAGTPTTEMDNLNSYVGIVDAQTGRIKCTLQVKAITGNRVEFKATPARSLVYNDVVTGVIADDVELDDYICSVSGTCIPTLDATAQNFMIQYAVNEMRRRLSDDSAVLEKQVLEDFRKQIESTWAGRDQAKRVHKKSRFLASPRYFRR